MEDGARQHVLTASGANGGEALGRYGREISARRRSEYSSFKAIAPSNYVVEIRHGK